MADTYFDYVLSQCRSQNIKSICDVVSTRKQLIEKAKIGFNGVANIIADWRFIQAVKRCLDDSRIINLQQMSHDTREVYDRCYEAIYSNQKLTYDRLFEILVDINWVMAGIQNSKNKGIRTVNLQANHCEYTKSIKEFLLETYNSAVRDNNECVYIDEALKAKGKIFTGLYPFQYEESKEYACPDYTCSNLKSMQQEFTENSIWRMSLFYGLTATAALADDIRRFS